MTAQATWGATFDPDRAIETGAVEGRPTTVRRSARRQRA